MYSQNLNIKRKQIPFTLKFVLSCKETKKHKQKPNLPELNKFSIFSKTIILFEAVMIFLLVEQIHSP